MFLNCINVDEKFLECTQKVNTLNTEQFTLFLKQVITLTHSPSTDFTEDDIKVLSQKIDLNQQHVYILLKLFGKFYKKLSTIIVKPTDLQKALHKDLNLKTEHCDSFVKLWSEKANEEFGNFENKKQLENISWQLNVETTTNSGKSDKAKPKATVQLSLAERVLKTKENVKFELSQEQLQEMYDKFEIIQEQLDLLNKYK